MSEYDSSERRFSGAGESTSDVCGCPQDRHGVPSCHPDYQVDSDTGTEESNQIELPAAPGVAADAERRFTVAWTVTERHEKTYTASELAEALGVTVQAVLSTPVGELDQLESDTEPARRLYNVVTEDEDGDTYQATTDRAITSVQECTCPAVRP